MYKMGFKTAIFDIDGTIANCKHRLHYIKNKPKNWKAFFAGIPNDSPITETIDILKSLYIRGYIIILCTGRPEETRSDTDEWLKKQGISYDQLYMRPLNDYRSDVIVKEEILDKILKSDYNPVVVFEDRTRIVEMWRRRGLICYQVDSGDF